MIKPINLIRRKYILPPVVCMYVPLIFDIKDPKWILLGSILNIFDSRRVRQEMAKQGIKPVKKSVMIFRIVLMAIFFSKDVSYVLRELREKPDLRKFAGVNRVPSNDELHRFMSRFSDKQFIDMVLRVLNIICTSRSRGKAWIVVDSTDIKVGFELASPEVYQKISRTKGV